MAKWWLERPLLIVAVFVALAGLNLLFGVNQGGGAGDRGGSPRE